MLFSDVQTNSRPWMQAVALLATCGACFACGDEGASEAAEGADASATPTPTSCIPDPSAGDHVIECNGLRFLTKVDAQCFDAPCGLIVDVHGFSMSGQQMRDNTLLQDLAPEAGYITIHPSAPGAADPGEAPAFPGGVWTEDLYPDVLDFVEQAIAAYGVDEKRVHFTGFSQGGAMTWWFVCNHSDLFASAAPNAAAFGADGSEPCVDADWSPRIPLLYMNGVTDTASTIEDSRTMRDHIVGELGLSEVDQDGDETYSRVVYEGDSGEVFDYIEHNGGGQAVLAGHCIPGGIDVPGAPNNYDTNATTCTTGDVTLNWGEAVLEFFQQHPKP